MSTTEHTINDAIARLLRGTRRAWRDSNIVKSENNGMLRGSNARPDILVLEPNVSPVAVETEVLPAVAVEAEAVARLGERIRTNGRTILSTVAVRLPVRLRQLQDIGLEQEIANAGDIELALFTGSSSASCTRWPRSGWIRATLSDLSILIQSASVPPDVIEEAADHLTNGVIETAGLLDDMATNHPGAIQKISEQLHQEDDTQTRRMAATILANAFMFHGSLAGGPGELARITSCEELRGSNVGLGKSSVLAEWRKILEINYWPIFDIARRILEAIPTSESKPLIDGLVQTADSLLENRLMRSHDLTGAVFQRLIADRKFLAAFYTTPASAALLVGLAITPEVTPAGGSWGDAESVKALKIADFACGTGTLVSTAYQRISQLHELAGGDAEAIHPDMMNSALVGCDVLPAAAHLTASMLAGAHPTVQYKGSSILTVAYGEQPNGNIALGSLNLLDNQGMLPGLSITSLVLESAGVAEQETWRILPNESFDAVIMNPPFTRPTNHEGGHAGVPNPMFAAFGSNAREQKLMAEATKRFAQGTCYHGNAGEASIFLALADRKLKPGGMLALVMPLTLLSGSSWQQARTLLARQYSNLIVVTIAGGGSSEMSFSADTGMGECLIIGKKVTSFSKRATFVVLNAAPEYPLLGYTAAEQIRRLIKGDEVRKIEDGPFGGNVLKFGNDTIGHALNAPLPDSDGWKLVRVSDPSLAQTAFQLAEHGNIWLPTMNKPLATTLDITTVSTIATIGPIHRDINGRNQDGDIRGPFEIHTLQAGNVPTYPVLWAHDADRERTFAFEADCEGIPHHATTQDEQAEISRKVERVWATASHCHSNMDFQFNSQSTAMQFTTRKTIGGRAWLSIQLPRVEHEKALVLWANTSLGLLMYWWHSSRQQSGRGIITKQTLQTLPTLNVTTLSEQQLNAAVELFEDTKQKPLQPLHEIDQDSVRRELDERFARDVIGVPEYVYIPGGPLELVRMKLSQEPSIRGAK
ncbi:hypothetical protein [Aggregatilinea lenta]|uniref:hypothetical protein n=1 Tax=Aggregatilinea lenta TaxID=913108 RepID=UPI0013C2A1DA|nr:hypothetical protein [Aggregatilinea lenta]